MDKRFARRVHLYMDYTTSLTTRNKRTMFAYNEKLRIATHTAQSKRHINPYLCNNFSSSAASLHAQREEQQKVESEQKIQIADIDAVKGLIQMSNP